MQEPSRDAAARLELAARAAWLYYVGGDTQDVIASKLGLSRPAVQRLVALAVAERLVSIRLDHPVAACMRLAESLSKRHGLAWCEVAPFAGVRGPALLAAARLERELTQRQAAIVGISAGRAVRALIEALPTMERPAHRVVGLVGSIARDGSANPFAAVTQLGDRIGAKSFPLPSPAVVDSVEERQLWQNQRTWRHVAELADRCDLALVGVGRIGPGGSLHSDGYIDASEMADLAAAGAVGEILGWAYDAGGRLLEHPHNQRVTSPSLPRPRPVVALAVGEEKLAAILGALQGRLFDALVTDEPTATRLCEGP
jgi:DNA-binding transcriptional regulator LsrR (DeoR family)